MYLRFFHSSANMSAVDNTPVIFFDCCHKKCCQHAPTTLGLTSVGGLASDGGET